MALVQTVPGLPGDASAGRPRAGAGVRTGGLFRSPREPTTMMDNESVRGYRRLAAAVVAGVLRWNRREAIAEFLHCPLGAMWCAWLRLDPAAVERAVLEELVGVEASADGELVKG